MEKDKPMFDDSQEFRQPIKRKKIYIILGAILLLIMVVGITYAFVNLTLVGEKRQVITAGTLSLQLLEDSNNLSIQNAFPIADEVGMIQDAFTFRLINNGTTSATYKLKLVEIGTGTLSKSDVKYGFTKDGVKTIGLLYDLPSDGIIDSGTIGASPATIEYSLRLWIKDTVTDNSAINGKSLSYRVDVEVGQVAENESEQSCPVLAETTPNAPVLASGMIPVMYNETEKTWVKADSTNDSWYEYDNQIWANAVTVTEATRDTYKDLDIGEPISMNDINTMWVWIPRYSYTIKQPYGRNEQKCSDLGEITASSPATCRKLGYPTALRTQALALCKTLEKQQAGTSTVNSEQTCVAFGQMAGFGVSTFEDVIDFGISKGYLTDTRTLEETYPENTFDLSSQELPGAIDVKFISNGQKDTGTGKYETCAENWVTPEGFSFGNENLSGFWVGKFETTGSIGDACTSVDCTTADLTIKPNLSPVVEESVSSFFYASRSMQNSTNAKKYGFDVIGTGTMDTHMLKNTEWGIVAYLSQSKYGKYGNTNYEGANKEVYQNKSSSYTTGMSNGTPSQETVNTQVTSDTPDTGYGASTTGTIYGVYDMSGGAFEYVMGNYNNVSGMSSFSSLNSGFCGTNGPTTGCLEWPESKYYDLYTSDVSSAYKFGDATYETSGWYSDTASFVSSSDPWSVRGGNASNVTNAGVFLSSGSFGNSNASGGMRLSIKP